MPPLPVERVLEEEYAFLHPTPDERGTSAGGAAHAQPTLYDVMPAPATRRCAFLAGE